jgi:hypothetical protein
MAKGNRKGVEEMKTQKYWEDKADKARKKMEYANSQYNRLRARQAKRYEDRFVHRYEKDGGWYSDITELGLKELEKYDLYHDKNREDVVDYKYGIMYSPNSYKCGICGDRPWNDMSLGFAPRYAVCPKHDSFLWLTPSIYKVKESKSED